MSPKPQPLFYLKALSRLLILSLVFLFISCSSTNDVASNGLLQKRKYRKGFHLSQLQRKAPQQAAAKAQPQMATVCNESEGEAEEDLPEPLPENRDDIGAGLNAPVAHQQMEALDESWQQVNPATAENPAHSQARPYDHLSNFPLDAVPETVQKDTLDATTRAELIEKNNKRLKRGIISGCAGLLAALLTFGIGYVIPAFAAEAAFLAVFGFILYALGMSLMIASSLVLTITLFYIAEAIFLKRKSRTIFTPKFYKIMGWLALVTSILCAVVAISGGFAIGYIIAVLAPADIVGLIVLFLILYIAALISAVLYGGSLWLNMITLWFAFRKEVKGKIAAIVTFLSPVIGFLAFLIGISVS